VRRLLLGTLLVASACATGPTAPPVETVDRVCGDLFCTSVPNGWEVEVGDGYLAFRHPAAPDQAIATLSPISMEAMVENAGGSWPASIEDVVRSFWQLLEDAGVAEFGRLERLTGGSFRSEGTHEGGRLWHLLIPGSGSDAVAFEVRGPNRSWEAHADVFFSGVELLRDP
jgi:hypothetical protein